MDTQILCQNTGLFRSAEKLSHAMHILKGSILICTIQGQMLLDAGTHRYFLERGSILHLPAETKCRIFRSSENISFFWMYYTTTAPSQTWAVDTANWCDSPIERKKFRTDSAAFLRTENLFRQLLHVTTTDGYPSGTANLAAQLLLIEASRCHNREPANETHLVDRINAWIHLNAASNIRVADVAANFGYAADYISRVYRQGCGTTLKQTIAEARITLIKSKLLSDPSTVYELWSTLGFDNYKSFSRYFSYHVGMPPKTYAVLYEGVDTRNNGISSPEERH